MNRSELITALSEETTFSKKDIGRVLDSLTRILKRTLKKGEKVSWTGLGTFCISYRPARKGINPMSKEKIDLPAINVPKFRAGKSLKDIVRSVK